MSCLPRLANAMLWVPHTREPATPSPRGAHPRVRKGPAALGRGGSGGRPAGDGRAAVRREAPDPRSRPPPGPSHFPPRPNFLTRRTRTCAVDKLTQRVQTRVTSLVSIRRFSARSRVDCRSLPRASIARSSRRHPTEIEASASRTRSQSPPRHTNADNDTPWAPSGRRPESNLKAAPRGRARAAVAARSCSCSSAAFRPPGRPAARPPGRLRGSSQGPPKVRSEARFQVAGSRSLNQRHCGASARKS